MWHQPYICCHSNSVATSSEYMQISRHILQVLKMLDTDNAAVKVRTYFLCLKYFTIVTNANLMFQHSFLLGSPEVWLTDKSIWFVTSEFTWWSAVKFIPCLILVAVGVMWSYLLQSSFLRHSLCAICTYCNEIRFR